MLNDLGETITGRQVWFFSCDEKEDRAYHLTDWLGAARIKKRSEIGFPSFVKQLCKVAHKLADMHDAGYVHGDIQPDHFLIDDSGKVYLLDLALAHEPGSSFAYKGAFIPFVSPEIATGMLGAELMMDGPKLLCLLQSDVFSFGAMAYYLFTGKQQANLDRYANELMKTKLCHIIVGGPHSFDYNEEYSEQADALANVIRECMKRHPNCRPDMRQVGNRLSRIYVETV